MILFYFILYFPFFFFYSTAKGPVWVTVVIGLSDSFNWDELFTGTYRFPDNYGYAGFQEDMLTGGFDFMERYGMRMEAYFIPPATGVYFFRLSCDDNCMFYMGVNEQSKVNIIDFRLDGEDSGYLVLTK